MGYVRKAVKLEVPETFEFLGCSHQVEAQNVLTHREVRAGSYSAGAYLKYLKQNMEKYLG